MDGYKYDLVTPKLAADLVGPAASLGQGDIFHLRDEHLGVQTVALQSLVDLTCYISIIGELAEQSIRTPLAGSVKAVAIIEENLHLEQVFVYCKMERICGNNYFAGILLTLLPKKPEEGYL